MNEAEIKTKIITEWAKLLGNSIRKERVRIIDAIPDSNAIKTEAKTYDNSKRSTGGNK